MITLKTLKDATAQQVFNQVKNHLIKQGEQSKDELGDNCMYRGTRDLKCAAGCLIADDEYRVDMESKGWWKLCEEGIVPYDHHALIMDLQIVHDGYDTIYGIKEGLKGVAEKFALNYT